MGHLHRSLFCAKGCSRITLPNGLGPKRFPLRSRRVEILLQPRYVARQLCLPQCQLSGLGALGRKLGGEAIHELPLLVERVRVTHRFPDDSGLKVGLHLQTLSKPEYEAHKRLAKKR